MPRKLNYGKRRAREISTAEFLTAKENVKQAVRIAFKAHGNNFRRAGIDFEELESIMVERLPYILSRVDPEKGTGGTSKELIIRATRNMALNILKIAGKRQNLEAILTRKTEQANHLTPARIAMNHETEIAIREAIESRLNLDEKIVMLESLFGYGEETTVKQIAAKLGKTKAAIRIILFKARQKLRKDPVLRGLMKLQ